MHKSLGAAHTFSFFSLDELRSESEAAYSWMQKMKKKFAWEKSENARANVQSKYAILKQIILKMQYIKWTKMKTKTTERTTALAIKFMVLIVRLCEHAASTRLYWYEAWRCNNITGR